VSFCLFCDLIQQLLLRWARVVFLGVLGLSLGCSAFAQAAATANKTSTAARSPTSEGRQLFESVCAGCHGLDGRGGERGPDISTRQQVVQLSDPEILGILRVGRPAAGMPPFDSLGDGKLKALLAHLRSLQGKGDAAALHGDSGKGKALFFGKARCSECHMFQGAGGFLGRDLSMYGASLSAADIRSNILRPGDNSNKANKTAVITLRDSRKFTGIIRNEDNFSVQLQSFDGAFHFLNKSDVAQLDFLPEPVMPADYGKTLQPSELDDLLSFLVTTARTGRRGKKEEWEDEE
jgi:cytochrome c oxidase cbb3-type subunit III